MCGHMQWSQRRYCACHTDVGMKQETQRRGIQLDMDWRKELCWNGLELATTEKVSHKESKIVKVYKKKNSTWARCQLAVLKISELSNKIWSRAIITCKAPAKRSQHVNATYCNIVGRNMLRAFGYRVAMCCDMLGVVGSGLKMAKFEPTTPNTSQHGCVGMLRSFGWGLTLWTCTANIIPWRVSLRKHSQLNKRKELDNFLKLFFVTPVWNSKLERNQQRI